MKRNCYKLLVLTAALGFAMSANAQIITTVAGMGPSLGGYSGDGGPATAAKIQYPLGVALDASGNLFISDNGNNAIRKINAVTGIITTIAGLGPSGAGYSGDGGPATSAMISNPGGITVDGTGNIYFAVADRVRKINTAGIISTVAGGGTALGDGVPATTADMTPTDVAINSAGDIYIADLHSFKVRKVNHATGIITTVAGGGSSLGDGGPATDAQLANPDHITVDAAGNLYIGDQDEYLTSPHVINERLRKVDAATGIIHTIAGTGTVGYSGDGGLATAAQVNGPDGVAVDAAGNVFFGDSYNYVVRKINTVDIISTIAGNNTEGYSGDGGLASAAELSGFNEYMAVALDAAGNLYIADYDNNAIRKVSGVATTTTAPITGTTTVCAGATITLSDATTGGTWSSGSPTIATVGAATGIVSGIAGGIAVITYSVGSGSVTQTVTVEPLPAAIAGTGSVCRGHTIPLSDIAAGGTWSSGAVSVATVVPATGLVTGVSAGTAPITYTLPCGTVTTTVTVIATPCGTGIAETPETGNNINLYPNPVTRELTVTTTPGGQINSITIYNLLGQAVYIHEYSSDNVQVDVSGMSAGVYFIKINGTDIRKFLKE